MSTMEEINNMLKKLEEKLQATELKCSQLEQDSKAGAATTVVYQIKQEKSLKKFKEDDDIDEWMDIADIYVNRLKTESEKVDMILSFLDKKPYTEVRFRITRSKATAKEVFNVLRDIYGSKDSWTQLQQQFYNRQQGPAESLIEFSFELMALIMKVEKKHPTLVLYPDKLLKERFAEGVRDVSLKREMRRLNKERPDMKFFEIRDEANE